MPKNQHEKIIQSGYEKARLLENYSEFNYPAFVQNKIKNLKKTINNHNEAFQKDIYEADYFYSSFGYLPTRLLNSLELNPPPYIPSSNRPQNVPELFNTVMILMGDKKDTSIPIFNRDLVRLQHAKHHLFPVLESDEFYNIENTFNDILNILACPNNGKIEKNKLYFIFDEMKKSIFHASNSAQGLIIEVLKNKTSEFRTESMNKILIRYIQFIFNLKDLIVRFGLLIKIQSDDIFFNKIDNTILDFVETMNTKYGVYLKDWESYIYKIDIAYIDNIKIDRYDSTEIPIMNSLLQKLYPGSRNYL
jgi:hypothetical protein